jgi:cation diffusion facilitator CzcD-associated flavoprotein CzcO
MGNELEETPLADGKTTGDSLDAVVVGAGFAGMYMIYRLRELGLSVRAFDVATDVGGTWFWNRYPGARCDVESLDYSYSFSEELQSEWQWTEKFATQPEILGYANHVADRFDLRRHIEFETNVTSAVFDEAANHWTITTDKGTRLSARFCIMATGSLSSVNTPDLEGLESFRGERYHTGRWPQEGVDFSGRRVGVIGTGSSAIQSIPIIAQQAEHLTVFQRTPNFSLPARNTPLDPGSYASFKATYPEYRRRARESPTGMPVELPSKRTFDVDEEERLAAYEAAFESGRYGALLRTYTDLMRDKAANDTAVEFLRSKIRAIVKDPEVAEALGPTDHPFGTKRSCLDTGYFETYNRDNVTLVDLRKSPLVEVMPTGIRTTDREYPLDAIVFATGFDAITGALAQIDIRGREGRSLREKWASGPSTYLGLAISGFPNLFLVTGPGSPSVLSNMMVSIEQHVEWIADCIGFLADRGLGAIEATEEAEDEWVEHVNDAANATLYPLANSWYLGANIPGKRRVFMPYVGGVGVYREKCDKVAAADYEGFRLFEDDRARNRGERR